MFVLSSSSSSSSWLSPPSHPSASWRPRKAKVFLMDFFARNSWHCCKSSWFSFILKLDGLGTFGRLLPLLRMFLFANPKKIPSCRWFTGASGCCYTWYWNWPQIPLKIKSQFCWVNWDYMNFVKHFLWQTLNNMSPLRHLFLSLRKNVVSSPSWGCGIDTKATL